MKNSKLINEKDTVNTSKTLSSIELILDQCLDIWLQGEKIDIPSHYKNFNNVVITGMGGSAYAGHIIQSLFKDTLPIPVLVNSDYTLPKFVNQNTLLIITSYSGNTEECLYNLKDAKKKKALILGITKGGKLGKELKDANLPCFLLDTKLNLAGQPRLGVGYILFSTIYLLSKLDVIKIDKAHIENSIDEVKTSIIEIKKISHQLALMLHEKIPIILSAEFLIGNLVNLRNLFNETAKNFATIFPFPDLNHHLIEGLENPSSLDIVVIFISSNLYSIQTKKRILLTKKILKEKNIHFFEYKLQETQKLSQILNLLLLGSYTTFYLASLYKTDPSTTPWVDYFKSELSKKDLSNE